MNAPVSIRCHCGEFEAELAPTAFTRHNHIACYCRDCQAFTHALGHAERILDDHGGSEIVQVAAGDVSITKGANYLACLRLTEGGLHRFYARCCNTPLGNSLGVRLPFIGLLGACLTPTEAIPPAFGPIDVVVFTNSATGDDKPAPRRLIAGILGFLWLGLGARLRGDGKRHPFFDGETGLPVVTPVVGAEAVTAAPA